jgi:hypothetical protein
MRVITGLCWSYHSPLNAARLVQRARFFFAFLTVEVCNDLGVGAGLLLFRERGVRHVSSSWDPTTIYRQSVTLSRSAWWGVCDW